MKTLNLIAFILSIPFLGIAQKGHFKHHGHNKHFEKNVIKINDYHYGHNNVIVYNNYKKIKRKGPPYWAPAYGYRHRHIYFPHYQCYYDNYSGIYIYRKGGIWISSASIPVFIADIESTRKVELLIDNEDKPQVYFSTHLSLYH